jgi:cell volume regulation protein A
MVFFPYNYREKALLSWVGLKGSVPVVLATFPLIAGVENANMMFNIVFFAVLVSALLQGPTIPYMAKLLRVDAPLLDKKKYPIEFEHTDDLNTRLIDLTVPYDSWMVGKSVAEVGLPSDSLITLIARNENFIVPAGHTMIEAGDVLLTIVNNNNIQEITSIFARPRKQE